MCMEGIRIGRRTKINQYTWSTGVGQAQIVPPNPRRVALMIGSPVSSVAFIAPALPVTTTTGIPINTGQNPIILNIEDHGELVTTAWFGTSAAGRDGLIVEVLLDEE